MTTGEDLVKLITTLDERMAEARTERANLRDAVKDARREVPEAVEKAVRDYLDAVEQEVRDAMHTKVEEETAKLFAELRERLKLV